MVTKDLIYRYETTRARNRRTAGIPGLTVAHNSTPVSTVSKSTVPGLSASMIQPTTKANAEYLSKGAKKNMKRRENRQKKREEMESEAIEKQYTSIKQDGTTVEEITARLASTGVQAKEKNGSGITVSLDDTAKRIKIIRKKLRQIDDLEKKINSGALVNPEKLQLEKLAKKNELEVELNSLEKIES